ncbi:glucans biosynthesis glucosyltransferase MdoH [Acuticoccus sediminis]|uniref:Glucans biosynthesis glucosyltransferase H n=1 Tax=Acuticoccus sediminis TaxID=2184697 RepID=A0A8B2NXM2_9HYPH|nr:glucans biosynthesis glucosyltransferase MdoH [Acuticoccus sediminis]
MALPMDTLGPIQRLNSTPAEAPLAMPEQSFQRRGFPAHHATRPSLRTIAARATLVIVTLSLAVFGVSEMYAVAKVGGMAALEWVLLIAFTAAFGWIAFSAANALAGVFSPRGRNEDIDAPGGLTAIVMPVYNEDPRDTFSAIAAMVNDLPKQLRTSFEVFVISDTTNPETWIAEERALAILRAKCGPTRVWYRRRRDNAHRKAGNVADFVRRWGGRYEHMVMLDADSLMTGMCLAKLRAAMIADPRAGIIQTCPSLIGGATPFARAQQFANTVTGPVVSHGIAAWQGEDGNYWGHNAIIRMTAFASAAGLPSLPGKPPFGGSILSHDFVEAALIRRAGWTVTMRADITGSYEGAPTDLFGVIKRDRRWAQGNLQHARLIGAAGLAFCSRLHFAIGILAYVMSPVWLFLLLTGVALSVQATLIRPEYFPSNFALFPTWPAFDADRMVTLFIISLVVLLLPKMIAMVNALFDRDLRRGCGGPVGVVGSTFLELLISTLIAPIMMIAQTGIVMSILLGRAVGWLPQARKGASVSWLAATHFHLVHMACGLVLGAIALIHSPTLAAWMSPTLFALILAVPISKGCGSFWLGRKLRRAHMMLTPQESRPPEVLRMARREAHAFPASLPRDALITLAEDPMLCDAHLGSLEPELRGRGSFDPTRALAAAKLGEAQSLEELASWLAPSERMLVLSDTNLLDRALQLAKARAINAKAA